MQAPQCRTDSYSKLIPVPSFLCWVAGSHALESAVVAMEGVFRSWSNNGERNMHPLLHSDSWNVLVVRHCCQEPPVCQQVSFSSRQPLHFLSRWPHPSSPVVIGSKKATLLSGLCRPSLAAPPFQCRVAAALQCPMAFSGLRVIRWHCSSSLVSMLQAEGRQHSKDVS